MKEYIGTILCVAALCGIVRILSPDGKGGGLSAQMRFISSLCVLCVVAAPIMPFIKTLEKISIFDMITQGVENDESYYQSVFEEYVAGENEAYISDKLSEMICKEFDILPQNIEVAIALDVGEDECKVSSTVVYISGKAITKDPHKIIEYVEEKTGSKCEIIYK